MGYKVSNPFLEEDLERIGQEMEDLGLGGKTMMITGATGLIGSLMVRAIGLFNSNCSPGIRIVAYARNPEKIKAVFGETPKDVTFICQDIRRAINPGIGCDYVIHAANPTGSREFMTNPAGVADVIFTGTRNVLQYAKDHDPEGVVYLSSMEVFGQTESDCRAGEEELGYIDIHNIRSCYSEGKRMAECLCSCYAAQYGVPVRIARLAQTFGAGIPPGERRVFAQFAEKAIRGEKIVLHTTGKSMGNYVYTRDAVRAILLLLKRGADGEAYNVVNEESTMSIREMAEQITTEAGSRNSGIVFDIPEQNVYGYAPETKLRLSAEKIRDLGWKPEVGMKEAIQRMLPDFA